MFFPRGLAYGGLAAFMCGLLPVIAILLYREGLDAVSILFYRFAMSLPVIFLMMRRTGRHVHIGTNRILPLVAMGILMALYSLSFFEALRYMSVGVAATELYISPLIIAIVMAGFFHERLTWPVFMAIITCLAGLWLMDRTDYGPQIAITGHMLIIGALAAYTLYMLGLNHPVLIPVSTMSILFWVDLVCAVFFGVIIVARGYAAAPVTASAWGYLLLMAVTPGVTFLLSDRSVSLTGRWLTAGATAIEPLISITLGFFILHETIGPGVLAGAIIIIASVCTVVATRNLPRRITRTHHYMPSALRKRRQ